MVEESKKYDLFQKLKHSTFNKEDLSRKGSIDEPIRELVEIINKNRYYYTTSTCSGRITLTEKPIGKSNIKKGNKFHLNSHTTINYEGALSIVENYLDSRDNQDPEEKTETCLWMKFEPFIMHIQCYDLIKSRQLLNIVMSNGCRNSGVTFGNPDKFMLAVRSTSTMEVPIACDTKFDLNIEQLKFLCTEANTRLLGNLDKLSKLQYAIETGLANLT